MEKEEFIKTISYVTEYKAKDKRFNLLNQVAVNRAKIYLAALESFFDE